MLQPERPHIDGLRLGCLDPGTDMDVDGLAPWKTMKSTTNRWCHPLPFEFQGEYARERIGLWRLAHGHYSSAAIGRPTRQALLLKGQLRLCRLKLLETCVLTVHVKLYIVLRCVRMLCCVFGSTVMAGVLLFTIHPSPMCSFWRFEPRVFKKATSHAGPVSNVESCKQLQTPARFLTYLLSHCHS